MRCARVIRFGLALGLWLATVGVLFAWGVQSQGFEEALGQLVALAKIFGGLVLMGFVMILILGLLGAWD